MAARRGVCESCGCTDEAACLYELVLLGIQTGKLIPCAWVNPEHTLCSNPDCMRDHGLVPLEGTVS